MAEIGCDEDCPNTGRYVCPDGAVRCSLHSAVVPGSVRITDRPELQKYVEWFALEVERAEIAAKVALRVAFCAPEIHPIADPPMVESAPDGWSRIPLAKGPGVESYEIDIEKRFADAASTPPVDESQVTTTDGRDPLVVRAEQRAEGNVLHRSYLVLSEAERAKGFVRPVRDSYKHDTCGRVTIMSRALAETYARKPDFYGATMCRHCRAHYPVGVDGEFSWIEHDGSVGGRVGA